MAEITRIFYPSRLKVGNVLQLSAEEGRHIYKVLRGHAGDRIEVVDGEQRLFIGELSGRREAVVLEERYASGEESEVTLYQAVPKGRHMDLVVEKATELGVARIVPLTPERGVVRLSEGDGKAQRWRRVAEAAARQSLRLRVPEVREVVPFPEEAQGVGEAGVLLHNGPDLPALEAVVQGSEVSLFVGPEGGWSEGELTLALESGLSLASLGPFRLRSETAGMAAVALACAVLERTNTNDTKGAGRTR